MRFSVYGYGTNSELPMVILTDIGNNPRHTVLTEVGPTLNMVSIYWQGELKNPFFSLDAYSNIP
jgi:hypothetical protein